MPLYKTNGYGIYNRKVWVPGQEIELPEDIAKAMGNSVELIEPVKVTQPKVEIEPAESPKPWSPEDPVNPGKEPKKPRTRR